MYQHRNWQGELLNLPSGKVVCVGKNYLESISVDISSSSASIEEPLLFIKPETSLCDISQPIILPTWLGTVNHEIELAILIGSTLKQATESSVAEAFAGFGLALALTLFDVQSQLKQKSEPWDKAKGFDGACPISGFVLAKEFGDPQQAEFQLVVNGEVRQQGSASNMLTPILPLVAYMSQYFTLRPGDIVLTGTPSGIDALQHGDQLSLNLNQYTLSTSIM